MASPGPPPSGAHWQHTLIGLVWGAVVWFLDPFAFWWFAPVVAGMVLSIPLECVYQPQQLGRRARAAGLFLTPEEISPPAELSGLNARMAALEQAGETTPRPPDSGLAEAVVDPYVNAIHVSLLRERSLNPECRDALARLGVGKPEVRVLGEKLLAHGPEALQPAEKLLVLSDADVMSWAHRQAWLRSGDNLAPWWQTVIRQYAH